MYLVITEKPSVARSIADVIGAQKCEDGKSQAADVAQKVQRQKRGPQMVAQHKSHGHDAKGKTADVTVKNRCFHGRCYLYCKKILIQNSIFHKNTQAQGKSLRQFAS